MKTALLHYWLTNMRGGERVLAEFCRMFPDADLFTHAWNPVKTDSIFAEHKVVESWIGKLPGAKRSCQKYLPLMPFALKQWDFSGYDFLLSSESGPVKGINKPKNAIHVCYCHTPMRYLWDMFPDYFKSAGLCGKAAMLLFRDYLRRYDLKSAESVDYFIANSRFVAERIGRIYHRDSDVVYPPVDVEYFSQTPSVAKEDYYLFAGALIPYKRPDLAIAVCKKLKRKLIVVGTGGMRKELEKQSNGLITFAGSPPRAELRKLYASARGLLFPGVEDFGIVPLEAQAAGTPVIAFGAGGALETVVEDETGLFFQDANAESLADAVRRFENRSWDSRVSRKHAERFSTGVFRENMRNALGRFSGSLRSAFSSGIPENPGVSVRKAP